MAKVAEAPAARAELIPLDRLRENPENPRTISRSRFDDLIRSLREDPEFLWARPIVAKPDGLVIAGNMRLRAAKALGMATVPVVYLDGDAALTAQRILRDNQEYGEWAEEAVAAMLADLERQGSDLLLTGFETPRIDELLALVALEEGPDPDVAPALPAEPKSKPGEIYELGPHRVLCGDATDPAAWAQLMGAERARMCFTDPPWNVAIGMDSNPRHRQREGLSNDDLNPEQYADFLRRFAVLLRGYLDGDLYCVLGASEWPRLDLTLREAGYHWSATVIWVKDVFVLGRSKFHRRYEPVWYGWQSKGRSGFIGERDLDDVWEIGRPKHSPEHPTMKPAALVARAIRCSSKRDQIVVDPFLGSGTTVIAAEQTGRVCYGMEIDARFVDVTRRRYADFMGEKKWRP